jgi:hypothetical protein
MWFSHLLAAATAFWGFSEACLFATGAIIANTAFQGQDLVGVAVEDNGQIVCSSDWG